MEEILYYSYNDFSSILLIFFFHAVVFSILLLKNGTEENKRHSKWLAAFIFLGALYISPFMFGYAGWYGKDGYREFLYFMPLQQLFLIGPVFYFYVKTLLNRNLEFDRKDLLHFVPAIIYAIYILIVFITDYLILDEFYFYADGRDMDLDFWYQMAGLLSMLFYLYRSLKYYLNYRTISLQEVSFADEIAFKWIKHFIIAFSIILVLRVLFFILNPEWGKFGSKFWYYCCFSILLYYISITGYSNTIRTTIKLDDGLLEGLEPSENGERSKTSNEMEEDIALSEWKEKITQLFESKQVFKNSNLTLTDVADQLNTNRNIISKAINQEFQMNFNDFVNVKRAEAVIEQLKKGEHIKNTLLAIALDCGFNSKTTFNRAFKKHTSITPRQFIEQNQL
ncbi:MAG: helix-turn-helix transcriptional regulator [Bacteroidota bacterium]